MVNVCDDCTENAFRSCGRHDFDNHDYPRSEGIFVVAAPVTTRAPIHGLRLSAAREMCGYLATASPAPVVAVVKTGDMVAVDPGWKIDDILSPEAGPAELDARLRLLTRSRPGDGEDTEIRLGELIMNERTYSARRQRRPLQLAHQEFELLKYLVTHPGRVFTRRHLLQEVWGFNYVGGSRTVDVHVRRIRAKLGREHESLIATVRNVGYKAVAPSRAE